MSLGATGRGSHGKKRLATSNIRAFLQFLILIYFTIKEIYLSHTFISNLLCVQSYAMRLALTVSRQIAKDLYRDRPCKGIVSGIYQRNEYIQNDYSLIIIPIYFWNHASEQRKYWQIFLTLVEFNPIVKHVQSDNSFLLSMDILIIKENAFHLFFFLQFRRISIFYYK